VQSPALKRAVRAWSSDVKDRTADVYSCPLQRSAQRVCSIFVLIEPEKQSIKVGPNIGLRFLDREKGAGSALKGLRMRLDYDLQAV
jgi:hypothetical protein